MRIEQNIFFQLPRDASAIDYLPPLYCHKARDGGRGREVLCSTSLPSKDILAILRCRCFWPSISSICLPRPCHTSGYHKLGPGHSRSLKRPIRLLWDGKVINSRLLTPRHQILSGLHTFCSCHRKCKCAQGGAGQELLPLCLIHYSCEKKPPSAPY